MRATTAATHRNDLSTRIRTATADAHQQAEHAPFVQDLLAGRLGVSDYARLAAQHHAIYDALERAVAGNTDLVIAPLLAPELARLPSLTADLEFLAGADWRSRLRVLESTAAYCEHLRTACFDQPVRLLAHHYVRYLGDLSGGQLIRRVLQRVYQFDDHRGTEFYCFTDIPSPKAFKVHYRQLLDDLPWDEGQQDELIEETSRAYRCNADILYELGPEPVLASHGHSPIGGLNDG